MAIAVGFLGLAALAAGFAGLKANSLGITVAKPDLSFVSSVKKIDGKLNKFILTLKNSGRSSITEPFVLNIQLGNRLDVPVKNIKVDNRTFANVEEGYTNLKSEDGSFDIAIKNYKLRPGQTVAITYWFAVPYEYVNDKFGILYTWDTTNDISELDETNNTNNQVLNTNMLVREPRKYWCLNFDKQCVTSDPINNGQDPNCGARVYYSTESSCQEAGAGKDYAYVDNEEILGSGSGYYTLVTSTEPVSSASSWGKNGVRGDSDSAGLEFGRISCELECEVTVMNNNNHGVFDTRWYLDETNTLQNDPNTTLEILKLENEDLIFVLHAGDIIRVKLLTRMAGPIAIANHPMPLKVESLSNKYSLGYWKNTDFGYIFEKAGLVGLSLGDFGQYFYYTVVLN
ncbi:MAG: hypothetical protein COU28_02010 [Candidatus Magasanikbacteria bacterium CG10_big_fil_rev_8_21_14_0_10_36_16]|uniref:CARDB domain-containing protein n=1 Tax=Candidatus Magasanikbacteria bacterium CG10_big_fil_rev_8_21_14_0_10_36_16 TaxID=1974645 RepID=A0A2H0TYQ7_9BACT|nr:MAG: hypothetical protein COU28_02010 [Candidatus Magasanikbacteria bacterium CG10_big_fil_rev_8_21_14_0_10_36_16]